MQRLYYFIPAPNTMAIIQQAWQWIRLAFPSAHSPMALLRVPVVWKDMHSSRNYLSPRPTSAAAEEWLTSDMAYLSQVAQIKTVSQGAVAPELKLAAHGDAEIQSVVDHSTGTALSTQVAAAAMLTVGKSVGFGAGKVGVGP